MKKFILLIIFSFLVCTSYAQSNLLLLDDGDVSYYMNSNADSVILHLVFDTVYVKSRGKDSISEDLSIRNNTLTSNFTMNKALSYSPLNSFGTSLHFKGQHKLFCDTTFVKDKDFRMSDTAGFTLEVILKTKFHSNNSELRNYYFSKHESVFPYAGYFMTTTPLQGQNYVKYQDDQGLHNGGRTTHGAVNDGKWHYLAMKFDRMTKKAFLYIDGFLDLHEPLDDLSYLGTLNAPKGFLTIGGLDNRNPIAAGGWFKGEILLVKFTKGLIPDTDILAYWKKIKGVKISCSAPVSLNAIVPSYIVVSSAENCADSTFIFKGTSPNPTELWKTISRDSSITDYEIEVGVPYYYRAKNLKYNMVGERIISDYSENICVTATDLRVEKIKNAIDCTFEPISVYESNFNNGTNGWVSIFGTWIGNVNNKWGNDNVLAVVASSIDPQILAYRVCLTANLRYAVAMDYYIPQFSTLGALQIGGATISAKFINVTSPIEGTWTTVKGNATNEPYTQLRLRVATSLSGDSIYYNNFQVSQISNWMPCGNHSVDTSSAYKYEGSYCMKVTSTGAGDAAANYISLDTTKFRELRPDSLNTFSIRARTSTSDVIMYVNIGGQTQSYALTEALTKYEMNFTATTNEVKKPIKIWLNKAVPEVCLDTASLR